MIHTCRNSSPALFVSLVVFALSAAAPAAVLLVSDTDTGTLQSLDPQSGAATPIGSFGGGTRVIAGLAYDPAANRVYGTSTLERNLYRINPATGAATAIGRLSDADEMFLHALAFDPATGKLFAAYGGGIDNDLYEVNPQTGGATRVGAIGFFAGTSGQTVMGLAVHPVTHDLYGVLGGAGEDGGLVRIDKATGAGTLVGPSARMMGLAFDPDTATLYGIDNGSHVNTPDALYTVDLTTGAATLVGRPGLGNPLGLEFVPEPGGAVIAGVAALALLARRRRTGRT